MSTPTTHPVELSTAPSNAKITTNPEALRHFDTTHTILRFGFPDAASQAAFHRTFALLNTEKEKAAFMQRFFANYDGVVAVPKVPTRWDTSGDEGLAIDLQAETPLPDTSNDVVLAQQLMQYMPPPGTDGDEEIARRLQGEMTVAVTDGDAEVVRQLLGDMPRPVTARHAELARLLQQQTSVPITHQDAAIARQLQSNNSQQTSRQNTDQPCRPQSNTVRPIPSSHIHSPRQTAILRPSMTQNAGRPSTSRSFQTPSSR
ncbi:hypothetical protein EK21DRAFT_95389 [Setomelanomma holmii]|uniref:Uncharacterized protein n=1 Tax=Setomelanomma holmii TaxID=210430 RepID=A0A9P4GTW6_9PLEO|nr:hypothetical protein EK21DRAFT_95389 [Setomelanomma holmii]